jgi:hypothetical protein
VKSKPQLSDLYYYRDLQNKSADAGSQKFEYSIKEIPITNKMFVQLVNMINESGYWKLSHENICDYPPSDASTFILETNTPTKYKYVSSIECPGDTSKYRKACQELINYAGMGKEIKLIWNGAATTAEPVKIKELKLQELKEVQEPISKPKKGKDK